MKEIKDLGFGVIQVNEPKPTMSKMESVDNYLCKWQKLKEWLVRVNQVYMNDGFFDCAGAICEVIDKMQELGGEDE